MLTLQRGDKAMSGDFWGMTAFLVTTIIFAITTMIYALKASRLERYLNQLKGTTSQDQSRDYGRHNKK